ncbi:extensin [Clupea harengus]|uniref:Extensin n=1 Tax=Clupea harengus TaxID=7950 RepID=A0A8M1KNZ3_CLUHA|nr:extensin [Clupea harengus]
MAPPTVEVRCKITPPMSRVTHNIVLFSIIVKYPKFSSNRFIFYIPVCFWCLKFGFYFVLFLQVEEHHEREARSASKEQGLRVLLTEMKETLSSINQKTNIQQQVPPAPQEPLIQRSPTITLQAPSAPTNYPDPNPVPVPVPGPTHINLVLSTQPQQLQPQAQVPQIPQLVQPLPGMTQGAAIDPNTLVLSPCGQPQANSQVMPCYLPYSGLQSPGPYPYLQYNPNLQYPPSTGGLFSNPLTYPSAGYNYGVSPQANPYPAGYNYGVSPINPQVNPYPAGYNYGVSPINPQVNPYPAGYNYGVSPINPQVNPYAAGYNYGVSPIDPQINPYPGYNHGMTPNLSITPPIIFREGPSRPAAFREQQA